MNYCFRLHAQWAYRDHVMKMILYVHVTYHKLWTYNIDFIRAFAGVVLCAVSTEGSCRTRPRAVQKTPLNR